MVELDEPAGSDVDALVKDCPKEIQAALKAAFEVIHRVVEEAETRMQPVAEHSAGTARHTSRGGGSTSMTPFFSPAKAIVNFGAGWPDTDDEEGQDQLVAGRQGGQATEPPKKRKLERHFLDRGVWVHVGMYLTDKTSDAIFSDLHEI